MLTEDNSRSAFTRDQINSVNEHVCNQQSSLISLCFIPFFLLLCPALRVRGVKI